MGVDMVTCPKCKGDGAIVDLDWKPKEINNGHQGYRPCRVCGGRGKVNELPRV